MKLRTTLFICFISLQFFAQNIQGIVLDEATQQTIAEAHVYAGEKPVAVTNEKGVFTLNSSIKDAYLVISHVGYVTQKVQITDLQGKQLTVYLKRNQNELNEVLLATKKKELQRKIQYTKRASLRRGVYAFATGIHNDKIFLVAGENSRKINGFSTAAQNASDRYIQPTFNEFFTQLALTPNTLESFSSKLMVYDIKNDSWGTSNLEFRERTAHNLHIYNDDMYIFGGRRVSGNREYLDEIIEIYNIKSNTIKKDDTNPHQAVNFASFLYGDYIIFMGGITKITKRGIKKYNKNVHFYNLKTGFWYALDAMPNPKETQGVLVNDVIYLIGGFYKKPLKDIESFNLKTGKWKKEGTLFTEMTSPAVTHHGNQIYIYDDGKITTYNTDTKILNEYLINLEIKNAELFYHEDALYILGGYSDRNGYNAPSRRVYSINIDEFSKTKIRNTKKVQLLNNL